MVFCMSKVFDLVRLVRFVRLRSAFLGMCSLHILFCRKEKDLVRLIRLVLLGVGDGGLWG